MITNILDTQDKPFQYYMQIRAQQMKQITNKKIKYFWFAF